MKLIFSLTPAVSPAQAEALLGDLRAALPGTLAVLEADGTRLLLEVPAHADRMTVADTLRTRLFAFGVDAREIEEEAPAFTPITNLPFERRKKRTVSLSVFILSLVATVLVVGVVAFSLGGVFSSLLPLLGDATLGTRADENAENYIGKIATIDEIFRQYSLYDTDGRLLLDEMLKAYAAATGDRYAAYYTEEEFAALMTENRGDAVGVGVTVIESVEPRGVLIVSVLPESPAMQAGVCPGDVVVSIGSGEGATSLSEVSYEAALDLLRGQEGSVAEVTVLRGEEELFFSITRAKVQTLTVTGKASLTDPTVGIVRIEQFDLHTPVQFRTVMEELIAAGCTRFVYDVRNNPGGDLASVCAVLSCFLNEGDLIASIVKKDGTTTYEYANPIARTDDYEGCSIQKEDIGRYRAYPATVLINGFTASAAELFVATLRDYSLATAVGENTFGKGVLQYVFSLEAYGYRGGIKLTTGYYAPPCGKNYDGKGVAPTEGLEASLEGEAANKSLYLLTEQEDTQLGRALLYFQSIQN